MAQFLDQQHGLIAGKIHFIEQILGQQVPTDKKEQVGQVISESGHIAVECRVNFRVKRKYVVRALVAQVEVVSVNDQGYWK
jgi:hypothetical protein